MGNAQASPEPTAQTTVVSNNNSNTTSIFKKKLKKVTALNTFLDPNLILASSIVGSEEAQVEFESKLADGTSATCYKGQLLMICLKFELILIEFFEISFFIIYFVIWYWLLIDWLMLKFSNFQFFNNYFFDTGVWNGSEVCIKQVCDC